MLYVPPSIRPDWTVPALLGSITGVRTKLRHHPVVDARPQIIRRRESTSSLLVQQSEKLAQIKGLYSLRDAAFVMGFLRIYPALIDLLLEAPTYLERTFGPNPQVVLEIVVDPESEDSEELFANIRTSLPVEEALERLNQLDDVWFLAQLGQTGGRFNFNLEFI